MATYKYDIYFDFMGEGDPVRVTGENILALAIDYAYDSEAIQPTVIMKARLDRNLVDKLVTNKATGKIQLHVDKTMVDNDPSGGIRKPYIDTTCVYDIPEDVKEDNTVLYDKNSDKQDVYTQITIGLLSHTIIERNTVSQDLVIKDCNMMGAVCFFTSHMPMVIEPFTYNDMIDQLIIEPQETTKSMIRYLNDIKVFYDTPLRYYMSFNATYLLSSSGKPVPVEGEQSSTVVMTVRESDNDADSMQLGVTYNKDNDYYEMKIMANDAVYAKDNATNKIVNKLIGILDPGRDESNPGLGEILQQAKDFMKSISDAVSSSAPDIGGGINSVVHGKNVMDYNTYRVEYHSNRYLTAANASEHAQKTALDKHYQAAKSAGSSNNGTGSGSGGGSVKLVSDSELFGEEETGNETVATEEGGAEGQPEEGSEEEQGPVELELPYKIKETAYAQVIFEQSTQAFLDAIAVRAEQILDETLARFTNEDGEGAVGRTRKKDKLPTGNSADQIYKRGVTVIKNLDTKREVGDYLAELHIGQNHYDKMESKSIETGYGITSYEGLVNGVDVTDVHRNIDTIAGKKDVNTQNAQYVSEEAAISEKHVKKSDKIAKASVKDSISALQDNIKNCNKLWEMAKKNNSGNNNGSGSGSGGGSSSNGTGSGNNGAGGLTEEEHKKLMDDMESSLTKMKDFQSKFSNYYSQMDEAVDDGVTYGENVTRAQVNINPFSDGLTDLGDTLSAIAGIVSGVMDIAKSIDTFTDNLKDTISQVTSEGLGSLGISSISQLLGGGIANIGNLTGAGKTGISFLETGIFGLIDGGHEKVKYVNLDNDNPNKIKGMQRELELRENVLAVTKDNIDNSIITLNKEYLVQNTDTRSALNGRYLLSRKQEAYIREGDLFICKTIMEFKKI